MKVIFLDVDGVLNSAKDGFSHHLESEHHLQLLDEIVKKSGAEIVLSSSWRKIPSLRSVLEKKLSNYGITIYGETESIPGTRGTEIKDWLDHCQKPIQEFVILDDDSDMDEYTETKLVKTSYMEGLQPEHVTRALEILNGKKESAIG